MTEQPPPLQDRSILLTRPATQAGQLLELLEQQGARCSCLPLFDIEPLAAVMPAAAEQYAGVIFTSRNAVLHGPSAEQLPGLRLAVGPGTAAALAERGAGSAVFPDDTRSEGLLALPQLADIADQRWLIVKGQGGRDALIRELKSRGARVDILSVYRRRPLEHDAASIGRYIQEADAVIIFSGEGLQHLWQLCPAAQRSRLARLQLVVPSPRVVKMALDIGFITPARPARSMSDTELAAALRAAMPLQPENHKGPSPQDHD